MFQLKAVFFESFQGCIDKLEVLVQNYPEEVWKELDWSEGVSYDLVFLNWQGCPINLDTGVHFMGKGWNSKFTYFLTVTFLYTGFTFAFEKFGHLFA